MAFGKLAVAQITTLYTPIVVYTAPSNAVIQLHISNPQGIPMFFSLSIGTNNPALGSDFIAQKKVLLPNIHKDSAPFNSGKIALSTGEIVIVTLYPPDNSQDYYDPTAFAMNVRVSGVDGTDLTAARYSF